MNVNVIERSSECALTGDSEAAGAAVGGLGGGLIGCARCVVRGCVQRLPRAPSRRRRRQSRTFPLFEVAAEHAAHARQQLLDRLAAEGRHDELPEVAVARLGRGEQVLLAQGQ